MHTLYQCLTIDNTTHSIETCEEGNPGHSSYWITLDMAELDCLMCAASDHGPGYLNDGSECPECQGYGMMWGQPYVVYRYDSVPLYIVAVLTEDPGDGYEWTKLVNQYRETKELTEGIEVLSYKKEYLDL
jgi:hypothetical protein